MIIRRRILDNRQLALELERLVQDNLLWMREHPETFRTYAPGHLYRPDPDELFKSVRELVFEREGDCEDWAAARAAEWRAAGELSRVVFYEIVPGAGHAVVELPALGIIEDPARALWAREKKGSF